MLAPGMPLIAVGAPSHSYYPTVAREMGVELISPPHADVANAVGAVLGKVVQDTRLRGDAGIAAPPSGAERR